MSTPVPAADRREKESPAQPLPASAQILQPGTFDRYEILELVGTGGMGEVYRALDPSLNRTVAIKLIKWDDPELVRRFVREARSQARVEHPNVCRIYESVMDSPGKRPYIVMQLIRGGTLKDIAPEITMEQKVRIIREVADALHAAHKQGLIHRDIKPSNVLVERNEEGRYQPYITDFGLAKEIHASGMTLTGTVIGTLQYMSPEQARGHVHQLDRRSDVFSLGSTLYELLSGVAPFSSDDPLETLQKIVEKDALPLRFHRPGIPQDLETIVLKAIEKDPQRRYDSARAFAEDLSRYLGGDPILARRSSRLYRIKRKLRKHKAAAMFGMIAVFVILLTAGIAIRTGWQAAERVRLAQMFGQEVERVEATLRQAYLLPLHDTRKDRQLVERKLQWIKAQLKESGSSSYGPGYYALGKGSLVLGRHREAQTYLEKAWNDEGFREPEVAYALGYALAMRYQEELEEIDRIFGKEEREKKTKELDRALRDPALRYLKEGSQVTSDAVEFVEALLAYLSRDYDRAVQKTIHASEKLPLRYESEKLLGDIYLAMAHESRDTGDSETADRHYRHSEEAYRTAVRKGESDGSIYEALCSLSSSVMWMHAYMTGGYPESEYQKGAAACEQALVANPESRHARVLQSTLTVRWAQLQMDHGENPDLSLRIAIESGKHAVLLAPQDASTHSALGLAYFYQAEHEFTTGKNAESAYMLSIQSLDRAIALRPAISRYHINRGNAYLGIAESQIRRGHPPSAALNETIRSFETAIQLNPLRASIYANLGIAYWDLAEDRMLRGVDHQASFEKAEKNFQQSLKMNPKLLPASNNLAGLYISEAQVGMRWGKDPSILMARAQEQLQHSLSLDPENFYALHCRGLAYALTAEFLLAQEQDPSELLGEATVFLKKSLIVNPGSAEALANSGYVQFLYAYLAYVRGQSPFRFLEAADGYFDRSLRMNAHEAQSRRQYGYSKLLSAKSKFRAGHSPERDLQEAEQHFQEALRLQPESILNHESIGILSWYRVWILRQQGKGKEVTDPWINRGIEAAGRIRQIQERDPAAGILQSNLQSPATEYATGRNEKMKETYSWNLLLRLLQREAGRFQTTQTDRN